MDAPVTPGSAAAGRIVHFTGAGVRLAADVHGPAAGAPVLFLHGGGQTRASWGGAAIAVAGRGYRAITMDLRGHGESDWAEDGDYRFDTIAKDIIAVIAQLGRPPVLVGASLGGLASLMAVGAHGAQAAALILVDIAPQMEPAGASKIGAFMTAHPDGFASLEEAADAVAAYLPHRPRPKNPSGLMKNLRERGGRLYWHWDPRMMGDQLSPQTEANRAKLDDAARNLKIPTLLIRGGLSEVVSLDSVKAFRALAPHAEFVDVAGADHMVAGDANDPFNAAVIDFISRRAPA